jgi:hypothetical protein
MAHSGYIRISFASLAVFLLCSHAGFSQEPSCTIRKLPVSFRDEQNIPVQNISVADLEAKVRGKAVKFLSLAPDPRPHRLVLLLDTSGSMGSIAGEPPPWRLELSLARHFFAVNHQKSQIALLFFNDQVNDLIDFSQGNSAVADKLQQIDKDPSYLKKLAKGKTALRDAILLGLQLLDHPSSADALYVLTDAGDNASTHSASDLIQRLSLTSVRLFAIVIQDQQFPHNRVPEELSGPGELSDIAKKSGGEILSAAAWHAGSIALSANSEAKVKTQETLARLYQTILQDSLLEIELPFPPAKNERWDLKLSNMARRKWKGVQVTYPNTLLSCDTEVAGSGRH